MKTSILLALLSATILCITTSSQAAEVAKDKSSQSPKSDRKHKQVPFRGKVSAVDNTAKTVTLEGKETGRTYQITSVTKITNDGKPAIMADVIVGLAASGLAKESAEGKWEVVTLNIGAKAGKAKGEKKAAN